MANMQAAFCGHMVVADDSAVFDHASTLFMFCREHDQASVLLVVTEMARGQWQATLWVLTRHTSQADKVIDITISDIAIIRTAVVYIHQAVTNRDGVHAVVRSAATWWVLMRHANQADNVESTLAGIRHSTASPGGLGPALDRLAIQIAFANLLDWDPIRDRNPVRYCGTVPPYQIVGGAEECIPSFNASVGSSM